MAGIYARVEKENGAYGVVWPPANVSVLGVTHLELELDFGEAGELADESINPLIMQSGRGIVVFGARTLSSDLAYQFINSRRVISMITEQLRRDNEWAVFETNNPRYLLESGQVNVEIRMRPVGTAEQIVIDLRLGG
jgi:hypothetical protein